VRCALHELHYTFDDRLLDGERELVRLDSTVGPFGRLISPQGEYDIARRKRRGWHMELNDARSNEQTCEFRPRLLRRGGRLIGAEGTVKLAGRPVGPSHWVFAAQGARIEATTHAVLTAEHQSTGRLEVSLQGSDWVGAPPVSPITLAFGCWLIVQWETEVVPSFSGSR
jgi:hypothetical protein